MRQFSIDSQGEQGVVERPDPSRALDSEDTLILPYELRQKSRLVAALTTGEEVLLVLPRGTLLRGGTRLRDKGGRTLTVCAATQSLSWVACSDAHRLARLAYHLGNRHIPLQIEPQGLWYEQDSVLDRLVERLGGQPVHRQAPFEPESGAYGDSALLGHSHHVPGEAKTAS